MFLLGKIEVMSQVTSFIKAKIFLFSLLSTMTTLSVSAYEQADAFIVKIYDEKVRVLSPKKFDEKLTVIVENKTLTLIKGRLETGRGEFLKFVSVAPSKSVSMNVKRLKTDKVFFVPLAPPSQKVELKLGNKPYEIPPSQ